MSGLDGSFIKAYGRPDRTGEGSGGVRVVRASQDGPFADPASGQQSATRGQAEPSGAAAGERIQVHKLKASTASADSPSAQASATTQREPDAAKPRLALHTIDDDVQPPLRTKRTRQGTTTLRILHETPSAAGPHFIGLDDITRFLEASPSPAAPVIAQRRQASSTNPDPCAPRTVPPVPGEPPQAAYQVGRFSWPEICHALVDRAADRFAELNDELKAGVRQGRKVLAIAGCRGQSGATTLLLAAASQLAASGLSVALFDGDLVHPDLATNLALLPQLSWHEMLIQDLPSEECWVESREERLTLIPLLKPLQGIAEALRGRLREMLRGVREAFQLVLVDVGAIASASDNGILPLVDIDGLILTHDLRHAADGDLERAREQVLRLNLPWWGIAENFA
jgi:Mrp family chromosome partitioning ATPase